MRSPSTAKVTGTRWGWPVGPTVALPGEAELKALVNSLWDAASPVATQPEPFPSVLGFNAPFDVHQIRRDFPILQETVNGRPLVWLDNAATTQKPQPVIDRLKYFYEHENSNIHRAAHELESSCS